MILQWPENIGRSLDDNAPKIFTIILFLTLALGENSKFRIDKRIKTVTGVIISNNFVE